MTPPVHLAGNGGPCYISVASKNMVIVYTYHSHISISFYLLFAPTGKPTAGKCVDSQLKVLSLKEVYMFRKCYRGAIDCVYLHSKGCVLPSFCKYQKPRGTQDKSKSSNRDKCEICHGEKGGIPGNENIVDGKIICDYCHAEMSKSPHAGQAEPQKDRVGLNAPNPEGGNPTTAGTGKPNN